MIRLAAVAIVGLLTVVSGLAQAQGLTSPLPTQPPQIQQTDVEAAAEPLTLAQAHAVALRNHPGIAAADFRAQAERQVFVQARSGLLPQVNVLGSAVHAGSDNTRIMAGGLNNPSVLSRTALGVGVSQLITDFGHTSNIAASAKLSANAADHATLATREQVLLEVDRDYFGALQAQAVESVARQTLETRQLLVDRVTVLAENKLKSELDVSFARVALEEAQLLVLRAHSNAESALAALSTVLGYREQQNFTLVDAPTIPLSATTDVSSLIEQALRDRPELAGLRDERDAALHLARAQRDARLPTISAVVAAGDAFSHDARLPDNYSAAGLEVTVPLFAGGLYQAKQREAELRAKAAAESLRTAEDSVSRDVRIAWLDLGNARARLRTTGQLRRYAATAYDLADARYKAGSSSIVELSQAQLALTSAQIEETAARYDVLLKASDLNYQVGIVPAAASEDSMQRQ